MQREPKLLLRLSENDGYLSRSAISCIDCRLATLGTRSLRSPHKITDFAGTPVVLKESR
jgi:hypothetical protein